MSTDAHKVVGAHGAEITLIFLAYALTAYALVRGASILLEDLRRWGGDGFSIALLLPGAPPTWGTIYLLAGVLSTIGLLKKNLSRLLTAGLYIAGGWTLFFAVTFIISAAQSPFAPLGSIWTNIFVSIFYIVVAVGVREVRKEM